MLTSRPIYLAGSITAICVQTVATLYVAEQFGTVWAAAALLVLPALFLLPGLVAQSLFAVSELRPALTGWHFMWLCIALGGLSFRTRDAQELSDTPVDAWALFRIAASCIVALVLLLRSDFLSSLVSTASGLMRYLFAYCCVCLLSAIWSVYPAWTLYKSFEFTVDVVLVGAILVHFMSADAIKSLFDWTWVILTVLLILVWLGVALWPAEAINHDVGLLGIQIQGVVPSISSNGVGDLSAMLGLIAFLRLKFGSSRKLLYTGLLAVSLISLVLAQTRTAIAAGLAGLIVCLLLSRRIGVLGFSGLALAGIVYITGLGDVLTAYILRNQSTEMVLSLTGRTDWWEAAWLNIMQRPLLGYGAYAGARFATLALIGSTTTPTIHNTYIEIALGTGLLGLLPFIAGLAAIWFRLVSFYRRPSPDPIEYRIGLESAGILALLTVRSFFTTNMVWHTSLDFLLVLAFTEFVGRRRLLAFRGTVVTPRLRRYSVPRPTAEEPLG